MEEDTVEPSDRGCCNKRISFKSVVELPIFCISLASMLSDAVFKNFLLYQACTNLMGFNETVCEALVDKANGTSHLEELVQPKANNIHLAMSLVKGIVPAIMCLFLGSWSDKNGRKPLLICSSVGFILYFVMILILMKIPELNPWWFVLTSAPLSLTGGMIALMTGGICYICDITKIESRSFRLGLLEGYIFIGILISNLTSSHLLKSIGYFSTIIISAVLALMGFLLIVFVLDESVKQKSPDFQFNIFNSQYIVDVCKTCFKKRPDYNRSIMWMMLFLTGLGVFVIQGEPSILYFFTRTKFDWDLATYMNFSTISSNILVFGTIAIIIVFKKFSVRDSLMSLLSFGSSLGRSLIILFASASWQLYLADSVGMFRVVFTPTNRSIISKRLPGEDLAKVFSLLTSIEALFPLAATASYNAIYLKTISDFPSAFSILSAAVNGLAIILLCVVDYLIKRNPIADYENVIIES